MGGICIGDAGAGDEGADGMVEMGYDGGEGGVDCGLLCDVDAVIEKKTGMGCCGCLELCWSSMCVNISMEEKDGKVGC